MKESLKRKFRVATAGVTTLVGVGGLVYLLNREASPAAAAEPQNPNAPIIEKFTASPPGADGRMEVEATVMDPNCDLVGGHFMKSGQGDSGERVCPFRIEPKLDGCGEEGSKSLPLGCDIPLPEGRRCFDVGFSIFDLQGHEISISKTVCPTRIFVPLIKKSSF